MLKIQRASAGSGKTFTLAGTFISLFLTIRDSEDGPLRLRRGYEIQDSLQHILAVTFTNKATAEMKERIVEKLSAIANADPSDNNANPDYLNDICKSTRSSKGEVIDVAKKAMRTLLFDYSAFNVSTIDSFFQTILRTFAYETDLNDSYVVELDDDLTTTIGVDETLDQTLSGATVSTTRDWIKLLMFETQEGNGHWNPFQRNKNRPGVYKNLITNARKMESEEFKLKRHALDDYFDSNPDLLNTFKEIDRLILEPRKKAYKSMSVSARKILDGFKNSGLDMDTDGSAYLKSRIHNSLSGEWNPMKPTFRMKSIPKSVFKKGVNLPPGPYRNELESTFQEWGASCIEWMESYNSNEARLWKLYRELLPYVPLLNVIGKNIRNAMEETNSMQISETNTMLKRIIGEDETPFIYERMGTRINHYLIDEFQDTSRLQWENFHPLLSESESRNNSNLIIGDAKQSIYRFRNADPSLITDIVPAAFPGYIPAGYSVKENTNWRSARHIVEFNNLFFHTLSNMLSHRLGTLYNNVVQHPHNQEKEGYVEIRFYQAPSSADEEKIPEHIRDAGNMVRRLLKRGYQQRDIAFLTRTKEEGKAIVEAFMAYNQSMENDNEEKIEFISDQSLLVDKARSTQILISALRTIAKGMNPEIATGEEAKYKVADWHEIAGKFSFMASRNPELSPEEIIRQIIDNPKEDNAIADMINGMQSVALPSMVESITETFVPDELKYNEAAFISAFQDAVLSYCENNPSDIASFLNWWDRKADSLSITSPENINAVNIMTIHKSKGLEFPVVIVPSANMEFSPLRNKPEWGWVTPDSSLPHHDMLPPWIPVIISSDMEGSVHENLWRDLEHMVAMDSLNMAYVAFTRASAELYVYSPFPKKKVNKFSDRALDILDNWGANLEIATGAEDARVEDLPSLPLLKIPGETDDVPPCYTYGEPLSETSITALHSSDKADDSIIIDKYHVNSNRGLLQYRESEVPDTDGEDDSDPRSEGNLMHDIMSRIRTMTDLPRAVKRLRIRGLISPAKEEEIMAFLSKAIKTVESYGWFSDKYRVINERALVKRATRKLRPDRILTVGDEAIVIDYKFGAEVKSYRKQVAGYIQALRETGKYRKITGYLWYLRLNKIVEVSE